jgi:hypothetical protein
LPSAVITLPETEARRVTGEADVRSSIVLPVERIPSAVPSDRDRFARNSWTASSANSKQTHATTVHLVTKE